MKRKLLLTTLLFTSFATCARAQGTLPPEKVEDVPLPGGASRFDYQSMDSEGGRLYIAHLGANRLVVFDTRNRRVLSEVGDLASVHGVVTVFDERGRNLEQVWSGFFVKNAHSVAVNQRTHQVYFPLQDVGGKPLLRIVVPSDVK